MIVNIMLYDSVQWVEWLYNPLFRRSGVRQEDWYPSGRGTGAALFGKGSFEYQITRMLEALVRSGTMQVKLKLLSLTQKGGVRVAPPPPIFFENQSNQSWVNFENLLTVRLRPAIVLKVIDFFQILIRKKMILFFCYDNCPRILVYQSSTESGTTTTQSQEQVSGSILLISGVGKLLDNTGTKKEVRVHTTLSIFVNIIFINSLLFWDLAEHDVSCGLYLSIWGFLI